MREVSYDVDRDCVTIDEVRFSAEFLAALLKPGEGRVLTVYRRGNEVSVVDGAHPPARILQFTRPTTSSVSLGEGK